ncbi:hypothetical protein, conserved in T. vivax [Trypanosoma vivax Y486]|uniref:Uncharacterized protein n=1 Tax=Trypanosoma vivax (strain Y486) TaxID=1055687 RepID=F9WKF2_TRYVY|nr:hypothetical protein, conserved in T. vivax [Trypanosoma vivax Y486]|eukprot:CCD17972.1 hypothetical protein, conserved in T. vivax [Trypanosoma vivax Y486]
MNAKFPRRAILVLACAVLFGKVPAATSSPESGNAEANNTSDAWLCDWWRNTTIVERYAVSASTNVQREDLKLKEEYRKAVGSVDAAGPVSQHPIVTAVWGKAMASFWEATQLVNHASRHARSIVNDIHTWRRYFVPDGKILLKCENASATAEYNSLHNFTVLYGELKKEVDALFGRSVEKNVSHCQFYKKRLDEYVGSLKSAEKVGTLAADIRKGFESTEQALKEARRHKDAFDAKVAVGCEMETRLNVMKDTFVALKVIAKEVVTGEAELSSRIAALNARAEEYGVEPTPVNSTEPANVAAKSAVDELSGTLQKVLDTMYVGASRGLHALLGYGNDFKHNIAQCRNETQLERVVLLYLVRDERRHHFDDFGAWKEATENLWAGVTNMTDGVHVNCSSMANVSCESILTQMNSLVEVATQSRRNVEAKLGSAIRLMATVWEQVKLNRAKLEALEDERRAKEKASNPDSHAPGSPNADENERSAPGAGGDVADAVTVDHASHWATTGADQDDSFYGGIDTSAPEEDMFDFDVAAADEKREGRNVSTIVLAVVVPIATILFLAALWYALCRQKPNAKDVDAF